MTNKILIFSFVAFMLLFVKGITSRPIYAATYAVVGVELNNSVSATIPITVTTVYYHSGTSSEPGPEFYRRNDTIPVGSRQTVYSKIDDFDSPYYWISWSTSCSDPPVFATYQGTWGNDFDPGGSIAAYQADSQDVHCTTPNATPNITNTACASVGWNLTGVGRDGANIQEFWVYRSTNSADLSGTPAISFRTNVVGASAQSVDWGSLASGTHYVRVRAVSPQSVGSWSSVGSFTCGTTAAAASGLGANPFCARTGSGNIIGVGFGWSASSGGTTEQWLDYSVYNNNFAGGTFGSVNVGTGATSYTAPTDFAQGTRYYWRVNNKIGGNWYPSLTASFLTPSSCLVVAATPTPTPTPKPLSDCRAECDAPDYLFEKSRPNSYWEIWGAACGTYDGSHYSGTTSSLSASVGFYSFCGGQTNISWEVRPVSSSNNVMRGSAFSGKITAAANGSASISWSWEYEMQIWLNSHANCGDSGSKCQTHSKGADSSDTFSHTFTELDGSKTYKRVICAPSCSYGAWSSDTTFTSGACDCPVATPTPVPASITVSYLTDCVDGVNPLVHLTWTSNTGATGYTIYPDWAQNWSVGGGARSWNSPSMLAHPGAHNWYIVGTGGDFDGTSSNTVSITTATCSPPPDDPSNLVVSSSCVAGGPSLVFSWTNKSTNETGFWLDVSHDAFTGPSSTVASLGGQTSVWAVKGLPTTVGPGTTVSFTWSGSAALDSGDAYTGKDVTSIAVTNGGSGYSDASPPTVIITGDGVGAQATAVVSGGQVTAVNVVYGGKNYTSASVSFSGGGGAGATATVSTIGDTPLVPARGVTYTWRVKAYSADRQSNHVYPGGADGADADTIPDGSTTPPGVSFTTPNCMFDLQVTNNPGGNTQVYDPGGTVTFRVQVTNRADTAQVAYPGGGNLGAWTLSNLPSPGPNCAGTPVTPVANPPTNTIQSIPIPTLGIGASTIITLANFTASSTPGSYVANFYALPTCAPNNDLNWTNNGFQLTYAVSAKAWFQTTGGDVGARGTIAVNNPAVPAYSQSSYILAGNPIDSKVSGKWELNNYTSPLFPTNNTKVYDYMNSRFAAKATTTSCSIGASPVIEHCAGDMSVGATNMTTAGNWIIFVDGNLNVTGNITVGATTTLVFIVRNNITINTNVTQADGVYIAGGTFADYDNIVGKSRNTTPYKLTINGAVYAHSFDLSAFLSGLPACVTAVPSCDNSTTPTDYVVFQPKYLIVLSQLIGSPSVSWQEVAP